MKTTARISIGNSYSQIIGLSPQDLTLVRAVLSYRIDPYTAQWIPDPANHIKYLCSLKGEFPTGLLHYVLGTCKELGVPVETKLVEQTRPVVKVPNRAFKARFKTVPYQHQIDAVNAAKAQPRTVLQIPTGGGKSMVCLMLLNELKLKTLIVVPSLILKGQLLRQIAAAFISTEGIVVENIDSPALKGKQSDFDMLIIDEAHHSASATYRLLNKTAWNGIRYRCCLTATPFRNNKEEQMLYEGLAGPVSYELTYAEAVKADCIVPVEAYYYDVPIKATSAITYRDAYDDLIVNNVPRNYMIADLLKKLKSEGKSVLCLVKEVKHGESLAILAGAPFAKGTDNYSRRFIQELADGNIKCLIATEGLVGEGCDTKAVEFVIIASSGKAKGAFLQKCGRAVRKFKDKVSAKVILFKDPSHKYMLRHFAECVKIIKEYYLTETIRLENLE